ncbi:13140_t:CDS:2 [Ambispora gerdemannii]|uniref:13140_t:CDS:1 n=1 Tax=Ambispora gerdemannii TaxID=144530 RepID=A0A9N9C172_9GLOM|nr:13140_t:CDS:2 [Ambispora gerdemannii]
MRIFNVDQILTISSTLLLAAAPTRSYPLRNKNTDARLSCSHQNIHDAFSEISSPLSEESPNSGIFDKWHVWTNLYMFVSDECEEGGVTDLKAVRKLVKGRLTPETRSKQGKDALASWWEFPKEYQDKVIDTMCLFINAYDSIEDGEEYSNLSKTSVQDMGLLSASTSNNDEDELHIGLEFDDNDGDNAHSSSPVDNTSSMSRSVSKSKIITRSNNAAATDNYLRPMERHDYKLDGSLPTKKRKPRKKKDAMNESNNNQSAVDNNSISGSPSVNNDNSVSGSPSVNNDDNNNQLPDFVNMSDTEFTSAIAATGASGSFYADNNEDNEQLSKKRRQSLLINNGTGSKRLRLNMKEWTIEEDEKLVTLVNRLTVVPWNEIAQCIKTRNATECLDRWTFLKRQLN